MKRGKAKILQELHDLVSLKTANFGGGMGPPRGTGMDVDAFVKDRIRPWLRSWVIPLVEELLERELKSKGLRARREGKQ